MTVYFLHIQEVLLLSFKNKHKYSQLGKFHDHNTRHWIIHPFHHIEPLCLNWDHFTMAFNFFNKLWVHLWSQNYLPLFKSIFFSQVFYLVSKLLSLKTKQACSKTINIQKFHHFLFPNSSIVFIFFITDLP